MVEQKPKMQQQETARKRAEKTIMAAQKCATQKKFRYLCRRKVLTYNNLKSDTRVEQQTVELTTFRPEASSGKRNERQDEKAHAFMEKNR